MTSKQTQEPVEWWDVVAKRREWVASSDKSAPVRYVLLLRSELKPDQGIRQCFYSIADAEWLYSDTDGVLKEFLAYTHWTHPLAGNPMNSVPEPVSGELQQERDFLFDLAVSTDANRICDRDHKIDFKEQLARSKDHVEFLLRQRG